VLKLSLNFSLSNVPFGIASVSPKTKTASEAAPLVMASEASLMKLKLFSIS
jgi:hypothetical protein